MFTVKISSLFIFFNQKEAIAPKMEPKSIPPKVKLKKSPTIDKGPIYSPPFLVAFTISLAISNKTMQVPSLNKLSPSIKLFNFFGAPTSFSKAKTATIIYNKKRKRRFLISFLIIIYEKL